MFFLSNKVGPEQEHESSKAGIHENGQDIVNRGVCRICLEQDIKLIKPCKCNGSIEYVHEKCMISWIQSQKRQDKILIKCQICLQTINYLTVSHLIVRPDKCLENMDKVNPCYFALFLACMIIITIFSIILKYGSDQFLQSIGRAVIIGGLVFIAICFVGINSIIIGILITEKVSNIERVFNRKQQSTGGQGLPLQVPPRNFVNNLLAPSSSFPSQIQSGNSISVSSSSS